MKSMHWGILDWGIGGFDFVRRLTEASRDLELTYLSDAGSVPYGKLPAAALEARVQWAISRLQELGAERVVVACNAASTALGAASPQCVIGVIAPTLDALRAAGASNVLVLGGERTISSGSYTDPSLKLAPLVQGLIAQPLSALVERGVTGGREVEAVLAHLKARLTLGSVDVLVPACTHYTALLPQLLQAFQPARVIDPAEVTLQAVQQQWPWPPPRTAATPTLRVWTTGDPAATRHAALHAFGVQTGSVSVMPAPATP